MGDEEKSREKEAVIVVGYALEPKKVDSFMKPSLKISARERGIDFVSVDVDKPLISQGPFHCLIHKLYGPEWDRELSEFKTRYPDVIIVDDPCAVLLLQDRISMFESLSVRTPNQVVVRDQFCPAGIEFPVVAKPLMANGHEMSLVFDVEGVQKVERPVVLQEFVNHGGVVFKVYVAGERVRCVSRPSLPDVDVNAARAEGEGTILPFSRISNTDVQIQKAVMPPSELVNNLAAALREELKLNLFNFDLIRDSSTDSFLVIDINYFPGYAKIPGFEAFLVDFFLDITRPFIEKFL